eukprot:Rmarinus@m.30114
MSLPLQFDRCERLYHSVETTKKSFNDPTLQTDVSTALHGLEICRSLVDSHSIFSSNEVADDVNTTDIKYALVDYYAGELAQKRATQGPKERLNVLLESKLYFGSFLHLCETLEILSAEDKKVVHRDGRGDASQVREEKITRLRRDTKNQERLAVLLKKRDDRMKRQPGDDGDDPDAEEEDREHVLLLIDHAICKTLDHIGTMSQELEMLKHINSLSEKELEDLHRDVERVQKENLERHTVALNKAKVANAQNAPATVITEPLAIDKMLNARGQMHADVFKPSWIPATESPMQWAERTMGLGNTTVRQYDSADMYELGMNQGNGEGAAKEGSSDDSDDDDEKLRKARAWDDYKDDHRKGAGNMYRRG